MRLARARVQKYRSIKDTGWFEVEATKTILVGPNEAGKTALLKALEQLNAADGVPGFVPLRDYPRREHNDIDRGVVKPEDVVVVEGEFALSDDDRDAIRTFAPAFSDCRFVVEQFLDNEFRHRLLDAPEPPTYGEVKGDLLRLAAHADKQASPPSEGVQTRPAPSAQLAELAAELDSDTIVEDDAAKGLDDWLVTVFPLIEESNVKELARYEKLVGLVGIDKLRQRVIKELARRLPVFVYFSSYFRVRPLIHLDQLASRIDQGLSDEIADFGNICLLKLVGLSARQLSDLGKVAEPTPGVADSFEKYRSQLDDRLYKLNAASTHLTDEITRVWDPSKDEGPNPFVVRIVADQQYLKVVVQDEVGQEIEFDQRSEGFQWLVSFFTVFFAQSADKYRNAVLLLDEPGLSLHGLKQRDFRTTISRLADHNQILFTTHSPFLVGPDELDLVRVVEMKDRKVGTKVHTSVTAEDSAALLVLQEALGYDLAQSLFAQQRNLVLEGLTDFWYIEATSALLRDSGEANLNEKIALLPASSAGKVVYFATILHAHHLKVAALLDSDSAGETAATQDTLVHTLGNRAILRTKDVYTGRVKRPEIEDLLRETLLTVARDSLGWDATKQAATQSSRPVLEVLEDLAGGQFSKYRLAKAFVRWTRDHKASDLAAAERGSWTKLIETINKALK